MKKIYFLPFAVILFSRLVYAGTLTTPEAQNFSADQFAEDKTALRSADEISLIDHQASVFHIAGDVKILKKGGPGWQGLTVGTRVAEGDQIKTGKESFADIHYDDFYLNSVRIDANTFAEFKSIEPTNLLLLDGNLFNMLDGLPQGSSYEVSTPSAVAAVRGTNFMLGYNAAQKIEKTSVLSGTVSVFGLRENAMIDSDNAAYVIGEESLEIGGNGIVDRQKSQKMTQEEAANIQFQIEQSHIQLSQYLGGSDKINEGEERWQDFRNNPDKMRRLLNDLKEHGFGKLATTGISVSEEKIDAVLVDGKVVKNDKDVKNQNALVGAVESQLGHSSDEE